MTYQAVLFDLDGTLLDTIEDLADSMNAALSELGFARRTVEQCKRFVGDGVVQYALRALPEDARDERTVERCIELMRAAYSQRWHAKTRPYEGIAELLDGLAQRGVAISVLSNKPDDFTRLMVREMLGGWRFEAVRGVRADRPAARHRAGGVSVRRRHGHGHADGGGGRHVRRRLHVGLSRRRGAACPRRASADRRADGAAGGVGGNRLIGSVHLFRHMSSSKPLNL